jgi:hypothetical protein
MRKPSCISLAGRRMTHCPAISVGLVREGVEFALLNSPKPIRRERSWKGLRSCWIQQMRAFSLRSALVRLWMLASNDQRLNGWEQNENEKTLAPHRDNFLDQLQQDEVPIGLDAIQAHPLALIRALDDYLASTRPLDSQSASTSRSAYVIEEGGKGYWLVPVLLDARRHAAINRQPASEPVVRIKVKRI